MKKLFIFTIFSLISIFQACQKEEFVEIGTREKGLNQNSSLTQKLGKVSQESTSKDNVIDGTSAFRIKLPVTVTVNSQTILISSEAQFTSIQAIKDLTNLDDDIVHFSFPINVVLRNYQEIRISDDDDLDDLEDIEDDISEIECLSIIYPISINIYESNSQTPSNLLIQNDLQLINFVRNLNSTTTYDLRYPIQVIDSNSNTITITSNQQFLDVIDDSTLDCGLNGGNVTGFEDILKDKQWKITYFYEDDEDETSNFVNYSFKFNSDNTITVQNGAVVTTGTWNFYLDSGIYKLDLAFVDPFLSEMVDDWDLLEFSNTKINLKDDDEDEYLEFTKF